MVNRRHCVVGMGQNWVPLEMNVKSLSFLKSLVLGVLESEISTHPKNDASLFPLRCPKNYVGSPSRHHAETGKVMVIQDSLSEDGTRHQPQVLPCRRPRGEKRKTRRGQHVKHSCGNKVPWFLASLW